jgi:hypothetical protein
MRAGGAAKKIKVISSIADATNPTNIGWISPTASHASCYLQGEFSKTMEIVQFMKIFCNRGLVIFPHELIFYLSFE